MATSRLAKSESQRLPDLPSRRVSDSPTCRVGESPTRQVGESFFDYYEYLREFEAKSGTARKVVWGIYEDPISAKTPDNPPHCHVPLTYSMPWPTALKIFLAMSATALKSIKWRFSSLNHKNFGLFSLVPKSPNHTGFISVKTPRGRIYQAWAPLKIILSQD